VSAVLAVAANIQPIRSVEKLTAGVFWSAGLPELGDLVDEMARLRRSLAACRWDAEIPPGPGDEDGVRCAALLAARQDTRIGGPPAGHVFWREVSAARAE
jgi:hypothetical protein